MPAQPETGLFKKIPLRIVIIAPFVAQVVLVVGLVSYISFRNGQQAVNNVAWHLRGEITAHIKERLSAFLSAPLRINQINANAIRQGAPGADDPEALERYFWRQIQVFESVTSVYFGNTEGGLVDAGRDGAEGSLYIIATDGYKSGPFRKYAVDSQGNRADLLTTIPDFDARTRSWYSDAVERGGAVWSDVYILFTGQDMAISASRPVYDERRRLLGVVSNSIFISHLADFLKSLKIGESGTSFIMERSGLLVASSTDEQPFTAPGGDRAQRRLNARESAMPVIRSAAEFLTGQFGDYHNITDERRRFEFEIDGQRQFMRTSSVRDEYGIDWLVVVVIPESDFMAQIYANNRATAFLVVIASFIAIVVGVITARWVTRPIQKLNASTRAMANGEWDQKISVERIGEIDELGRSFNNMWVQLKRTLGSLTSEVAERKRAEETIRKSEAELRQVLQNMPVMMDAFDEKGRIIVWNQECERVTGFGADEIIGNPDAALLLYPDEGYRTYLKEQITRYGSKFRNLEWDISRKDGSKKTILWSNMSERFPIPGWSSWAVGLDITERKRAEEKLRASESLQRVVIESLDAALHLIDSDLRVHLTNRKLRERSERLGAKTDPVGERVQEAFPFLSDDVIGQYRRVFKTGEPLNTREEITLEGRTFINEIRKVPVKTGDKTTGVLTIITDVTNREKAERERLKMDKLDSVGALAGGIAHDFNNLLTGLFGNIEMVKIFLPADHEAYEFLESAESSMGRATSLTKQLLTFAKGGDPVKEIQSIGEVITETAHFATRGRNAKLKTDVAPDLWPVDADKGQLSQVIGNLVINAMQAMPDGGEIAIGAENVETSDGRWVEITARDEGIGIASQNLHKIFDPYFSTRETGSGLGLASAHSIIKKHNGAISVDSKPNQGAIFTIRLPAAEEKAAEKPAEEARAASVSSARILLLDDNEVIRQVTGAMLEKAGCDVSFAVDGEEAIEKFREAHEKGAPYDIVITDLTIPGGMGGREAAREILKIDARARLIVSSGYATDPVMANYKAHGFKGVAVKPYRFEDLQNVIRRVMNGQY